MLESYLFILSLCILPVMLLPFLALVFQENSASTAFFPNFSNSGGVAADQRQCGNQQCRVLTGRAKSSALKGSGDKAILKHVFALGEYSVARTCRKSMPVESFGVKLDNNQPTLSQPL